MRPDLLRIITRWEQSGQGEGGMDTTEDEHQHQVAALEEDTVSLLGSVGYADDSQAGNLGSLGGRTARALQSRASFLNGRPSYLLYFWEIADQHQLLQSSLQRLNSTTGASDTSCAPSTSANSTTGSSRARRRRQNSRFDDEDPSLVLPLVHSIQELTECQRQLVSDRGEARRHDQMLDEQREQSRRQDQSRERIFRRRAELSDLARKYRKLNAELNPTDVNSARLSEFYVNEGRLIEDEIQNLESTFPSNGQQW